LILLDVHDARTRLATYRKVLGLFKHEWHADLWHNLEALWEAAGRPAMAWDEDDLSLT
jgi:hypothetical protein